ncbi:Plasma membrane-associated protein [Candida albicans P60002]|nr:Plasma membrane-associated protein [Candida albicans P57055]KHC55166.1 Plasma membrane-associated protein [Candida albicans P60002]
MELSNYTHWEIVSYVQVFLFAILLVAFLVITSIKKKERKGLRQILPFFIFFTIFLVLKIVGGILGLVFIHQKTFNVSLFIPTFIFDSIGLGFIARSITSLVTHNFKYQDDLPEFFRSKHQKAKNNNSSNAYKKSDNDSDNYNDDNDEINYWPFRVLTIILIAAIVVNIVGTNISVNNQGSSMGTSLIKAGSILFLIEILLMILFLVTIGLSGSQLNTVVYLLIVGLVVLIVRCVFSILSGFHWSTWENPSPYIIYFGKYQYYTFLALLPEVITAIIILVAFMFW